jgi:hypothetical protein
MLLLTHALVHTLNPSQPTASALAIEGRRVVAAGTHDALLAEFGGRARAINLAGQIVLPGLTDAHLHLQHYAHGLARVDCETATLAECLRRVRERVEATPPGAWALGHGWQQNDWLDCTGGIGGFPTAGMLDEISTQHPIYLTAKSLHAGWANTAALRAAGIGAHTPNPAGGALQRHPDGSPTGILLEGAMSLVSSAVPQPTDEQIAADITAAQAHLWRLGLTGVHDFDRRRCFIALQTMQARGSLHLRICKSIPVEELDHAIGIGLRTGFGNDMLRIGNVKAFADGALGPRTAAMLQPYQGEPGNLGMLLLDSEAITEFGQKAARHGLALTIHAIGDRANHEALNAYASLRAYETEHRLPAQRHRLEHVQVIHPDDLPRLARHNIIASMQPIHATSDMYTADQYWGDRAEYAYAWQKIRQTGAALAFGSDAPVESPNPFRGIHAAVTRTRPGGLPAPEGWRPSEKLSVMQAVHGFTRGAAYAAGMEDRLGQLAPGFLADLIVLDTDPFTCEADRLSEILPVKTMVNGEWVYQA